MNRIFSALVLLSAFVLFVACGGETPTAVPPTSIPPTSEATVPAARATEMPIAQATGICGRGTIPAYIKEVVLAEDTEGVNYTPVNITDEFEPTQEVFHAVVTLDDAPANLQVGVKWYLVQAKGYISNLKLDETVLTIPGSDDPNVDFTVSTPENTWPPGTYCVEIYTGGQLALSKIFAVTPNLTPSNATTSVIKQVVLAQDIDPGTFEPINPTTTFKSDAPSIHATVQISQAPANTIFRSRWYPPAQEPLEYELITNGSHWFDFNILPSPDGFPTGEYTVQIYVNDELADTKTFIVE